MQFTTQCRSTSEIEKQRTMLKSNNEKGERLVARATNRSPFSLLLLSIVRCFHAKFWALLSTQNQ